jgi:hypothetical protein
MVVDQTSRLHKGVTDRGTDEFEAALLQILAHRFSLWILCRDLVRPSPSVNNWSAIDKLPKVGVQGAQLLLDRQHSLRVRNRSGQFLSVADDAFGCDQSV